MGVTHVFVVYFRQVINTSQLVCRYTFCPA